jgi:predicted O-methyltransferase YrrM
MVFDVVVVNYNTDSYLFNLLVSVRDRLPIARIGRVHVWDNASTDRSLSMLAAFAAQAPWLRVHRSPVNVYHGPALDRLLREHCRQEWVLVLDSDAEVLADFFPHLPPFDGSPPAFVGQMSAAAHQLYGCPFYLLLHRPTYLRLPPFRHHGAPGIDFFRHVEEHGVPYRRFRWSDWVRHYGQGTLRGVYARGEDDNVFFEFARREAQRQPPTRERRAWEDRFQKNLEDFLLGHAPAPAAPVGELVAAPAPEPVDRPGPGEALRTVLRLVPGARRLKSTLTAALTSAETEALHAAAAIGMNQRRSEIRDLYRRVKSARPAVILEFGTAYGGTLSLWTRLATDTATLISVDTPPWELDDPNEPAKLALFQSFRRPTQTLHLIRAKAWCPETRDEVNARLDGRRVDFLFLEAAHAPSIIRRAFEDSVAFVRPGGLVAIHHIRPRRTGWLREIPALWTDLRASFKTEELVDPRSDDGYGIGLITI